MINSLNKKDALIGFLSTVSVFFILFVLIFDIIPVWMKIVDLFFSKGLLDKKMLLKITDDSIFIHSRLLNVGMLLTLLAIVKKKITIVDFGLILLISFSTKMYELMDSIVHPYLIKIGFFNFIFQTNVTELNPQYTRIMIFTLLFSILLLVVILRKTRTIDRSFIFMISSSILVTTFLFHMALPMGMLRYTKSEKMEDFVSQAKENNDAYFCKKRSCLFFYDDFTEIDESFIGNRNIVETNESFILQSKEFFNKKENESLPIYGISGDFIGTYSVFKVCLKKEYGYMCSFDDGLLKSYGYQSQLWFSFLTSVAHAFWIFFGILFLFLHKLKLMNILTEKKVNQNKPIVLKNNIDLKAKARS